MKPAPRRESTPLAGHLLAVAQRGDREYLQQPAPGQFAVIDAQQREKAFFEVPQGASPGELRILIERHFELPAERVAEFVWTICPSRSHTPGCRRW